MTNSNPQAVRIANEKIRVPGSSLKAILANVVTLTIVG